MASSTHNAEPEAAPTKIRRAAPRRGEFTLQSPRTILSLAYTLGFFSVLHIMLLLDWSPSADQLAVIKELMVALTSIQMLVVAFWFRD